MQTLTEIRRLLQEAGLRPQRRFGQCFLIDGNLMAKLLELADVKPGQTVLEVGAGTGSLTEELLARGAKVVAVEIDRGLCDLLRGRLGGQTDCVLIEGDILAGKSAISPKVLSVLPPSVHLVGNLPYNIATPLVGDCLASSWRARTGGSGEACLFERMTFTVQREVADRLAAAPGGADYGPISILVALLGRLELGRAAPASAFWPVPKVASRMVRIDFDPQASALLRDLEVLRALVMAAFGQRRKQIGSLLRRPGPWTAEALRAALAAGSVDLTLRPQAVAPVQYRDAANALAPGRGAG